MVFLQWSPGRCVVIEIRSERWRRRTRGKKKRSGGGKSGAHGGETKSNREEEEGKESLTDPIPILLSGTPGSPSCHLAA